MKIKNVREAALELLESVEKNQAYSNLLLNQFITKYSISGPDVGLLTEIVYGTIQRKMTLDFYLAPFIKKKIENWVRNLLRLSLYQMEYLDKIPDRAVIFEAVEIAKRRGHRGISGMVNGVLRAIQREGLPSLEEISDPIEKLSIETSHPYWLVKRWTEQFGIQKTKAMCETNLLAPLQTARVNETKLTIESAIQELEAEGYVIEKSPIVPEAIRSLKGNLAKSNTFRKGYITVQDESSMLVAHALDIQESQVILDACAAPGGKTTHIAEKLAGSGKVIALDLHEHKVKLIQENAKRLGLENIEAIVMDSRKVGLSYKPESFDRVLVDAPCSGLGVLRKKPDIKYVKSVDDIYSLQEVQQTILTEAASLVKVGGILVYSTCTVDREENEEMVRKFLENNHQFVAEDPKLPDTVKAYLNKNMLQIFPQDFGGDGFFISCFKRRM